MTWPPHHGHVTTSARHVANLWLMIRKSTKSTELNAQSVPLIIKGRGVDLASFASHSKHGTLNQWNQLGQRRRRWPNISLMCHVCWAIAYRFLVIQSNCGACTRCLKIFSLLF